MKKVGKMAMYVAIVLSGLSACTVSSIREEGTISLRFISADFARTRAANNLPDTSEFILEVTDSNGEAVYSGRYSGLPEVLKVKPGSYSIRAASCEFEGLRFDSPQYGDEKVVIVPAGDNIDVCLECTQINAGIRIALTPDFLESYPNGVLFLKCGEDKLMYGYLEKRVAYFKPGEVSILMNDGKNEEILLTKKVQARDILTLAISVSGPKGNVRMQVDTARNWISETSVIGQQDPPKGCDCSNALTVSQAKSSVGEKGVWVCGYIVGGDLSSSANGISFQGPFASATNLAIASRASVSSKASCISVQLPSGKVRDALNLVQHPDLIGRQVYVRGDISAAYFGIIGIKNVTEYLLE